MARYTLSTALLAVASSTYVAAQTTTQEFPETPLASKTFSYPTGIPYQVDTDTFGRGTQYGYNMCNSTTEGDKSLCQTSFVNYIDDFCLWAPAESDSTISDTEGEEVAWCTKGGRGTRVIPDGALQGVQYIKTPDYIQIAGFIDQSKINIQTDDYGGELDPHGQDLRGNPMGGLMYSNAFPSNSGNNDSYTQVIEWVNFMGGNAFCLKVCDPSGSNPAGYCQHTLDRIGCAYNVPNNAQNGTYEVCKGDSMQVPGVYTSDGQTLSYSQPPESEGEITTMPYTATAAASSECTTYTSSALYTGALAASGSGSGASGSGSSASKTGSSASASSTSSTSGASAVKVQLGAGLMGVVGAVLLLA